MPFSSDTLPSFLVKMNETVSLLAQREPNNHTEALVQFENQITLYELRALLHWSLPEKMEENLKQFLAMRWERIFDSSASYTQQPLNEVNVLCLELAHMLSPLPKDAAGDVAYDDMKNGEGPYFLLMPSLTEHQMISGENIHQFQLNEFVLSDNGELFIPLMSCLEYVHDSERGEMRHQVMDLSNEEEYPPLLTPNEVLRVKGHSKQIEGYYELIERYNDLRFRQSNLGTELDKLAQALMGGGRNGGGGEEFNAGAAANEGIYEFNQFWENYPQEKKDYALAHYPQLEEGLGRLNRPHDADYRSTNYCVELIAHYNIQPVADQIRAEENELVWLKEKLASTANAIKESMKRGDYQVQVKINKVKVKNPQVMRQLFLLEKPQQEEVLEYVSVRYKGALRYALRYEPLALPQYIDLLNTAEMQEMLSFRFVRDTTPLIMAAAAGGKESVALLLEAEAEIDDVDKNGGNALHWAAFKGHSEVVELLIDKGAAINALGYRGRTALMQAVFQGRADVVTSLLKSGEVDITVRGTDSYNAFDLAIIKEHSELIKPLLFKAITLDAKQQGSCLEGIEEGIYPNVLEYAAVRYPLLLDDLITELKKQPVEKILSVLSSENREGKTPLMVMVRLGRMKAVEDFLESGADITAYAHDGSSVLHEAAKGAHANVLELLLTKASPTQRNELLAHPDAAGNTPLHVAVSNGGQAVRVLLGHGANITARNQEGENAFDIARKESNPKVMDPLILGANKLSLEEQRLYLSNVAYGAYENVVLYAMCEQPSVVNELLLANGKMEQSLAGHKALEQFFDVDEHIALFEAQLKKMQQKERRNSRYEPAVEATQTLIRELKLAKARFVLTEGIGLENKKAVFKQRCLKAIQEARPVLETHRELGKLVASLILVILTLPVSLPLIALGIFSLRTQSAQKLDWLENDLKDQISSSPAMGA